ncbi:MAG: hypothetical protein ABWY06_17820 [Pseudomonas sp.]|uniref:hypothetical protein n=1 Tax=Pseudomonas sp. TaxID=306 RepID=UPI0033982217
MEETIATTRHPFRQAFTWGALWLVGITAGLSIAYGNFSAEGCGRVLVLTLITAFCTAMIARKSRTPWGFFKVGAVFLGVMLVFLLVASFGGRAR